MNVRDDETLYHWCPFSRVRSPENINVSINRNHTDEDNGEEFPNDCVCLGSRCMAWRWTDELRCVAGRCGLAGDTMEDDE